MPPTTRAKAAPPPASGTGEEPPAAKREPNRRAPSRTTRSRAPAKATPSVTAPKIAGGKTKVAGTKAASSAASTRRPGAAPGTNSTRAAAASTSKSAAPKPAASKPAGKPAARSASRGTSRAALGTQPPAISSKKRGAASPAPSSGAKRAKVDTTKPESDDRPARKHTAAESNAEADVDEDSGVPEPAVTQSVLEATAYPHVINNILQFCDHPTLLILRKLSSQLRDAADAVLAAHIVIECRGVLQDTGLRGADRNRIPSLCPRAALRAPGSGRQSRGGPFEHYARSIGHNHVLDLRGRNWYGKMRSFEGLQLLIPLLPNPLPVLRLRVDYGSIVYVPDLPVIPATTIVLFPTVLCSNVLARTTPETRRVVFNIRYIDRWNDWNRNAISIDTIAAAAAGTPLDVVVHYVPRLDMQTPPGGRYYEITQLPPSTAAWGHLGWILEGFLSPVTFPQPLAPSPKGKSRSRKATPAAPVVDSRSASDKLGSLTVVGLPEMASEWLGLAEGLDHPQALEGLKEAFRMRLVGTDVSEDEADMLVKRVAFVSAEDYAASVTRERLELETWEPTPLLHY